MVKNLVRSFLEEEKLFRNLPRQLRFLKDTDSADNIALLSGENSEGLYRDFEETVFQNYSDNNNANIFAAEDYREIIQESDKLHEDTVDFFETGRPTSQVADLLAKTSKGSKTVAFGPREYLEGLKDVSSDDIKGFYDL